LHTISNITSDRPKFPGHSWRAIGLKC